MSNTLETLEQEAPVKKTKTPKPIKTDKPIDLPEPSQNEVQPEIIENDFINQIEWIPFGVRGNNQIEEKEPLQILVYFSEAFNNTKNGRITFSRFISEKLNVAKKIKFGSLNGKILFNINETEGYSIKLHDKQKKCSLSTGYISSIIYERFGLQSTNKSTYFKLKDLGNDFYLIDEIIK